MATLAAQAPETFADAAAALGAAGADGRPVALAGAGTKDWGPTHPTHPTPQGAPEPLQLRTTALDAIVAHNPGDMTATLQAGVALRVAQERFAAAGQMLALDPPPAGAGPSPGEPTIGGIVAAGDTGPLRHRYGAPRDLVVGATVALADGTIAHSGGTVIKNVAGYDLAKLFCGSFGTLGLILSVNVRLHPLPRGTATAVGASADPDRLGAAAIALAALPAELEALDVAWTGSPPTGGRLLARCAGRAGSDPLERARRVAAAMTEHGLHDVEITAGAGAGDGAEADEPLWARQRHGQRSAELAIVRVAAAPAALAAVLRAADACAGGAVGRAALGHTYVELAPEAVGALRAALPAGAVSTLLDAPPPARATITDPWGEVPEPALAIMRALKARFDPAGICNPGRFVGGI